MAVELLQLTAKVGHLSEDFGQRRAFSGVSKFLCDKIFAGNPQVSWMYIISKKLEFALTNGHVENLKNILIPT